MWLNETIQRDSSREQRAYELKPGKVPPAPPTELGPMLRSAGDHPETQGVEGRQARGDGTVADKQRRVWTRHRPAAVGRVVRAPNARIAAKEALAARDIAGMDDDVQPPPALAPDALRAVNWTGCKRSNT